MIKRFGAIFSAFATDRDEKSRTYARLSAESEGFEPPVPRRVQQISSLPRSTTPAALLLQAQI